MSNADRSEDSGGQPEFEDSHYNDRENILFRLTRHALNPERV